MIVKKTKPTKAESPRDWLRARTGVAEAAEEWAREFIATHELSEPPDIIDALVEAYEAGAAGGQRTQVTSAAQTKRK
jgi:hypothetical protein